MPWCTARARHSASAPPPRVSKSSGSTAASGAAVSCMPGRGHKRVQRGVPVQSFQVPGKKMESRHLPFEMCGHGRPLSRRKISWWKTATSAARLVPSDELEASSITQRIRQSKCTNSKHTGINLIWKSSSRKNIRAYCWLYSSTKPWTGTSWTVTHLILINCTKFPLDDLPHHQRQADAKVQWKKEDSDLKHVFVQGITTKIRKILRYHAQVWNFCSYLLLAHQLMSISCKLMQIQSNVYMSTSIMSFWAVGCCEVC